MRVDGVGNGSDVSAAAVVVAAGRGERLGVAAKCFLPLGGRPMLAYALDAIEGARTVRETVVVVGKHTLAAAEALLAGGCWKKPIQIVIGGVQRQDSVANGVIATVNSRDVVVIHDAARPLAEAALFDRCVQAAWESGAAIAATPVADTIKRVDRGRVVATVPRNDLWAAQTPQAFRRELLVGALVTEVARSKTFTDEAGLFEDLGMAVNIVPSEGVNLKITHAGDLAIAEAILRERESRRT